MFRGVFYFLKLLNQYQGFITLIVGGFAIYLYLKQRQDNKRDAARLIIQEIRYAEQLIKNARDAGYIYALSNKILPTNSWHKNIDEQKSQPMAEWQTRVILFAV